MRARLGPLEERQFRLLWAGQAVSAFGDGLHPVALAFAVVELTGSVADLGLNVTGSLALTSISWDQNGKHYSCSSAPYGWKARLGA